MTRPRAFCQVDVFTCRPTQGNPVAVVLDADGMSEAQMQAFARWTNLSETTFVTAGDDGDDYRVRIFTPSAELPFAGHPTLGTAHALLESGRLAARDGRIRQRSALGIVEIRRDPAGTLSLRLPPVRLAAVGPSAQALLARALRGADIVDARVADVGPVWWTVELTDARTVATLNPDLAAVAALGQTGLTVFGRYPAGAEAAFEVRSFAPAHGVDEDPVCGSGNGCVAALLAASGRRTPYVATQGAALGRSGRVHVAFDGDAITVGGHCVTVLEGIAHL